MKSTFSHRQSDIDPNPAISWNIRLSWRAFVAMLAFLAALCAPPQVRESLPQVQAAVRSAVEASPPATTFAPRKATKGREPPGVART